ncbi:MAG: hypothetical protein GEU95_01260 [Rhizobiales bacterium]|nr:hypothetical protein [Hyphomicrobiales bacterium]
MFYDKVLRQKRPDDRLDFDVDFARWMTEGDAIASADAEISAGGVSIDGTDFTDTAVKVWLIGGVDGETVHVTVEVTTVQGRVKEICFRVRVREGC